ncbi:MAG: hypothetical protein JRE47_11420 [Deltaproteobacteria bacterium]|nr:hypothetical protein [Deltaproteobacteria bacterium]
MFLIVLNWILLPAARMFIRQRKIEAILINIEETKKIGTFERFVEDCGLEEINTDILSARKELVGFTPIEVAV